MTRLCSRRPTLSALVLSAVFCLQASLAQAYMYWQCNGTPARWETSQAHYDVMRCSIPEGSQRGDDVIYAFDQWNAVYGMWDVFTWAWGTTDCVGIDHSDDRNQVYFGVPSQMDGAVGVTTIR